MDIHPLQLNGLWKSDDMSKQKDTDSHRSLRATSEDPQREQLRVADGSKWNCSS